MTATSLASSSLIADYQQSKNRLILLDYDGTLVSFVDNPADAQPDAALLAQVQTLADSPNSSVAIVSGRDKDTLLQWWQQCVPPVALVAEHGAWTYDTTGAWQPCRADLEATTAQWKSLVVPVLQDYCNTTPGAFIETKSFSLVWHCRQCPDVQLATQRMTELQQALVALLKDIPVVGVHMGAMIVELKNEGVDKGAAVERILLDETKKSPYDFVYIAGDDYTDEDMFAKTKDLTVPTYTIKVGDAATCAKYRVKDVAEHKEWLAQLVQAESELQQQGGTAKST